MAKMKATHEIRLRLLCLNPPTGANLEFGLQDRANALSLGQPQSDGSFSYEVAIPVSRRGDTNAVRFHSGYVHGTSKEQFLYLSLRDLAASTVAWQKRLKIQLGSITWDQIEAAPTTATFAASIQGSGSGTVPILAGGWRLTN